MNNQFLKFGAKVVAFLMGITIVGLPFAYVIVLLVAILEQLESKKK